MVQPQRQTPAYQVLSAELELRIHQQTVIVQLGQEAMRSADAQSLMDLIVRRITETLDVDLCAISLFEPGSHDLLLQAGYGWKPGYVGAARSSTEHTTLVGYTLKVQEPVFVLDLSADERFSGPGLLDDHGVVSGISLVIPGSINPYGVMGVYATKYRQFTAHDADFLQAIANLLAAFFQRIQAEDNLRELNQSLEIQVTTRTRLVHLIHAVTMAATEGKSVHGTIRSAMEQILAITGWQIGHALIVNGEKEPFIQSTPIWITQGKNRFESFRQVHEKTTYLPGDGLPGQAYESQKPRWVTSAASGMEANIPGAAEAGLETAISVPVIVDKTVVTILEFFSERLIPPDPQLIDALVSIGSQLGRVIERHRAEDKIRDSQRQLLEAQHLARIGSWEWDAIENSMNWSEGLHRIFGISSKDLNCTYQTFQDIVHPDDRESVASAIQEAYQKATSFEFRHRIIRPDGEQRVLYERGESLVDDSGQVVKMTGISQDVTDQIAYENKIHAQDQLLASVVASAQVTLWATDRQGVITLARRGGLAVLGVPQGDIIGTKVFDHCGPQEPICEYLQSALQGEVVEIGFESEDHIYQTRFSPVFNAAGETIGTSGLAIDITSRITSERALQESERRYRQVIESVKDYAIFSLDAKGYVVSWNQGARQISGYVASEVIGKPYSMFYPQQAQDKGLPEKALRTARESGRFEEEGKRVRKDQTEFWASVVLTPILDEDGQLQGYSKVVKDISNQKEAERALLASEARFRSIFESGAMGIAIIDLEKNFLLANPALSRMLNKSALDFPGLSLMKISHPQDTPQLSEMLEELISGKLKLFRRETRLLNNEGKIVWVNLTLSLVRDRDRRPAFIIGMVENITYRKRVEAELREMNRQLLESREQERLKLAQDLHDAPLQELYGALFQLEAIDNNLEINNILEEIGGVKVAINHVIDNLRSMMGELRPPALAPFGLESALREHADNFSKEHPEIELSLKLDHDGANLPEMVRITLYRIYQQAMANILRHAGASHVQVQFSVTDQYVLLKIEDDGQGFRVPMSWLSFTRKQHYGLAGAAERTELIGGKFEVHSEPGEGTIIQALVPLPLDPELPDD